LTNGAAIDSTALGYTDRCRQRATIVVRVEPHEPIALAVGSRQDMQYLVPSMQGVPGHDEIIANGQRPPGKLERVLIFKMLVSTAAFNVAKLR